MKFFELLSQNQFLTFCLTLITTIIPVLITTYKTKKLRFFNVYFQAKSEAFGRAISVATKYIDIRHEDKNTYYDVLCESLDRAALFSSDETIKKIQALKVIALALEEEKCNENPKNIVPDYYKIYYETLRCFRDEIANCRKGKF